VNFLSINATATACHDNRIGIGQYNSGFEICSLLEVQDNQTIIKEIPAQVTLPESTVKAIGDSASKTDTIAQNMINSQGITQDYLNNVSLKYDSTISFMDAEYHKTELWMNFTDMNMRKTISQIRAFWITFSVLIILILTLISLFYSWKYRWALKTFQYNL
jgi:hypothetical protein